MQALWTLLPIAVFCGGCAALPHQRPQGTNAPSSVSPSPLVPASVERPTTCIQSRSSFPWGLDCSILSGTAIEILPISPKSAGQLAARQASPISNGQLYETFAEEEDTTAVAQSTVTPTASLSSSSDSSVPASQMPELEFPTISVLVAHGAPPAPSGATSISRAPNSVTPEVVFSGVSVSVAYGAPPAPSALISGWVMAPVGAPSATSLELSTSSSPSYYSEAPLPTVDSTVVQATCPEYNHTMVISYGQQEYHLECAADYYGGDSSINPTYVNDLTTCLSACDEEPRCVAVSYKHFSPEYNPCYLKDQLMPAKADDSVWGAVNVKRVGLILPSGMSSSSGASTVSSMPTVEPSPSSSLLPAAVLNPSSSTNPSLTSTLLVPISEQSLSSLSVLETVPSPATPSSSGVYSTPTLPPDTSSPVHGSRVLPFITTAEVNAPVNSLSQFMDPDAPTSVDMSSYVILSTTWIHTSNQTPTRSWNASRTAPRTWTHKHTIVTSSTSVATRASSALSLTIPALTSQPVSATYNTSAAVNVPRPSWMSKALPTPPYKNSTVFVSVSKPTSSQLPPNLNTTTTPSNISYVEPVTSWLGKLTPPTFYETTIVLSATYNGTFTASTMTLTASSGAFMPYTGGSMSPAFWMSFGAVTRPKSTSTSRVYLAPTNINGTKALLPPTNTSNWTLVVPTLPSFRGKPSRTLVMPLLPTSWRTKTLSPSRSTRTLLSSSVGSNHFHAQPKLPTSWGKSGHRVIRPSLPPSWGKPSYTPVMPPPPSFRIVSSSSQKQHCNPDSAPCGPTTVLDEPSLAPQGYVEPYPTRYQMQSGNVTVIQSTAVVSQPPQETRVDIKTDIAVVTIHSSTNITTTVLCMTCEGGFKETAIETNIITLATIPVPSAGTESVIPSEKSEGISTPGTPVPTGSVSTSRASLTPGIPVPTGHKKQHGSVETSRQAPSTISNGTIGGYSSIVPPTDAHPTALDSAFMSSISSVVTSTRFHTVTKLGSGVGNESSPIMSSVSLSGPTHPFHPFKSITPSVSLPSSTEISEISVINKNSSSVSLSRSTYPSPLVKIITPSASHSPYGLLITSSTFQSLSIDVPEVSSTAKNSSYVSLSGYSHPTTLFKLITPSWPFITSSVSLPSPTKGSSSKPLSGSTHPSPLFKMITPSASHSPSGLLTYPSTSLPVSTKVPEVSSTTKDPSSVSPSRSAHSSPLIKVITPSGPFITSSASLLKVTYVSELPSTTKNSTTMSLSKSTHSSPLFKIITHSASRAPSRSLISSPSSLPSSTDISGVSSATKYSSSSTTYPSTTYTHPNWNHSAGTALKVSVAKVGLLALFAALAFF